MQPFINKGCIFDLHILYRNKFLILNSKMKNFLCFYKNFFVLLKANVNASVSMDS